MERLSEALGIIDRLQSGEKLTFAGKHYTTDSAELYSPPARRVPILMAAGGPKSAAFAGAYTDGIITSVKVPQQPSINPFAEAAKQSGRPGTPLILATRWYVFAGNDDEAW